MKKKLLILVQISLMVLLTGCSKTAEEKGGKTVKYREPLMNTAENWKDEVKEMQSKFDKASVTGTYIEDLYMNKSTYMPGEKPVVNIQVHNPETSGLDAALKIVVKSLSRFVTEQEKWVKLNQNETIELELPLKLPDKDFTGYAVEVYLYRSGNLLDYGMTAVDVSSDWNVFPRYAYLTNMEIRTKTECRDILKRLLKHHINGLFYYDVIDRHDKPLAGTSDDPEEGWNTLAWKHASGDTVRNMIKIGHEYSMNSFIYNLIFGAYDNFEENGIKKEWGLYKDKEHKNQDSHDLSGLNWETSGLWLFNPADKGWQEHYLKVHKELLQVYDFDGIQVDSLGNRGRLYDYEGNEVALNRTYPSLLNRLNKELKTKILFNPVSGYGLRQLLEEVNYDILYMEVWPGDHKTYASLKTAIDNFYRSTKGRKGNVIAAYMNYGKRMNGGSFNTPGVNFTNAALMAAGGSHLELGDTGMLSGEYYPGDTLTINHELEEDLRNYYSFMVAYENVLRGQGLKEIAAKTFVDGKLASYNSESGNIWGFTKVKEKAGIEICHLINLSKAAHVEWVDYMGTQTEPPVLTNRTVKHYVSIEPKTVHIASPDFRKGIIEPVEFETARDEAGMYVTFQLPYLKYWTMIVIQ